VQVSLKPSCCYTKLHLCINTGLVCSEMPVIIGFWFRTNRGMVKSKSCESVFETLFALLSDHLLVYVVLISTIYYVETVWTWPNAIWTFFYSKIKIKNNKKTKHHLYIKVHFCNSILLTCNLFTCNRTRIKIKFHKFKQSCCQ
jgi:hypothetical protein